jgi:hypothetical protein
MKTSFNVRKKEFSTLALTIAVTAFFSQMAVAASPEIESALSESLHERVEVVKTYESNGVSGPQEGIRREKERPIAVEVGDSLPTVSSDANIHGSGGERNVYREKDIASKLDRELRDVDRSMSRDQRTAREARRTITRPTRRMDF